MRHKRPPHLSEQICNQATERVMTVNAFDNFLFQSGHTPAKRQLLISQAGSK